MCGSRRSCRRPICGIVADLDYKDDWAVSPGDQVLSHYSSVDRRYILPRYPYKKQPALPLVKTVMVLSSCLLPLSEPQPQTAL